MSIAIAPTNVAQKNTPVSNILKYGTIFPVTNPIFGIIITEFRIIDNNKHFWGALLSLLKPE
ncbi:putative ORFan [Tupanvirus deep ocean]|uniref:ORFan n=2 Tax=Tupanvirus TaxID=2094720 RepID=A0AC62A8N3_9VIRU|nr:putative ORFan [Tupanvirus deep ocean]QKU34139.1 putative ORFan [Tupanvirus deep ocean]